MKPRFKKMRSSFTLIEMLIVIGIIGILTTISMTSFTSAQRRARDVTRKSQILSVQSALERYHSANNIYAPEYCKYRAGGCSSGGTYVGGSGACEVQISDDSGDTKEPAFDVNDVDNDHKLASGFLLPFMGKPRLQASTISDRNADGQINDTVCTFAADAQGGYPLKNGRIRMVITRDAYWVSTVLENKIERRNPSGASCIVRPSPLANFKSPLAPQNYNGSFIAFAADVVSCPADDNSLYKLFARGSRGDL